MRTTVTVIHCDVCKQKTEQTIETMAERNLSIDGKPYKIYMMNLMNITDICESCSNKIKEFIDSLNTEDKSNH